MNQKESITSLIELGSELEKEKIPYLLEALDLFRSFYFKLEDKVSLAIGENTATENSERINLRAELNRLINKEKGTVAYRRIIREHLGIEEKMKLIISKTTPDEAADLNFKNQITDLLNSLESFIEDYEEYTRTYSLNNAISLALTSNELINEIESIRKNAKFLDDIFKVKKVPKDLKTLEIYLSNVESLEVYGKKLQAIHNIYIELLTLYGEKESDFPIEILSIGHGSLWTKIAGHTLTATMFTALLTSAADFYMAEYTKTGKLAQLPVAVKTAEDILNISKQLEKDGIDTTEIKSYVESATRKISKNLDELLSDQPNMEINNVKKGLGSELQQKLIEESKVYQIDSKESI